MKHKIEFNLPEDKEMLDIHIQAFELHMAVNEFAEYLRSLVKYHDDEKIDIEIVRRKFYEILNDRNVTI